MYLELISGALGLYAKYREDQKAKELEGYRASLAEENAKRSDILHLERMERANKEGILDAGLFKMKAEMSGLSGASADLWIGQRYMDVYKDVNRERVSRQRTVSRFLKEAKWHREGEDNAKTNIWMGIGSEVINTATKLNKNR
ncbi:hypothetical protein PPA191_gp08 [Liberibacter phage P-PA19-1]|nr:hypothetical protein PPA191_gp08 [Liberibacter phage P-PA19-1]